VCQKDFHVSAMLRAFSGAAGAVRARGAAYDCAMAAVGSAQRTAGCGRWAETAAAGRVGERRSAGAAGGRAGERAESKERALL
jgi:hypothetical protein